MNPTQPVRGASKGIWMLLAVVGASGVIVACSMLQRPENNSKIEPIVPSAVRDGSMNSTTPADSTSEVTPTIAQKRPASPLTPSEIKRHQDKIAELIDDNAARIEARRRLLGETIRRGPTDLVLTEFVALLDDVAAMEGPEMARRVAFSEAGTWQADEHYDAAIEAYQYIVDAYPTSGFAVESLYHIGECEIEQGQYAAAEETFRRLIEQHDDSEMAGWGWRKLALAQLLQGKFDGCLATLEMMALRFTDGEFGEYARARRGYVLMVAGKKDQARLAFDAFLSECPSSKYCRLVKSQMLELDGRSVVARAGS